MLNRITVALLLCLSVVSSAGAQTKKTDREHYDLEGTVKTVQIKKAKYIKESGKWIVKETVPTEDYSYDDKGRLVENSLYSPQGERLPVFYRYTSKEERHTSQQIRDIRTSGMLSPGSLSGIGYTLQLHWEFKYDGQGNRIEEICYWSNHQINYRTVYTYDEKGQRKSLEHFAPKQLAYRKTFSHDDKGNIAQMSDYEPKGSLRNKEYYSYEFDSTGNWIKRTTSKFFGKDDKFSYEPSEVTYRTITYY